MAKSKFHQENPEEFRKYNAERTKKYRMENPDKIRQYKENEKKHQQAYRNEHRLERNKTAIEENKKSLLNAVNNCSKWTLNDIKQLESLIKEGKTYKEIAEIMGRSVKSVNNAKQKYLKDLVTEYKKVNYYDKDFDIEK